MAAQETSKRLEPSQPDRFPAPSNQYSQPQEVALVLPMAAVAGAGVLLMTVGAAGIALNWKAHLFH